MPFTVSRTKVSATVTSEGNSLGGNTPALATISHSPSTTTNGNALRAIARQRALGFDGAAIPPVSAATSAMGEDKAIQQSRTSDLGSGPSTRHAWLRSSNRRAARLTLRTTSKPQGGHCNVSRHQGHRSADHHHRLASARELV